MPATRMKFATQMDQELLAELRTLAKSEGRQIQAVVEEAVFKLLEERRQGTLQPEVLRAYRQSHARFRTLYEKLAS